jgi:hypothetical protein
MRVPSLESIYLRRQSIRCGVDPMLESSGIMNVLDSGLTDETIRHFAALALCLPEPLVLSCSGFEGCGLVCNNRRLLVRVGFLHRLQAKFLPVVPLFAGYSEPPHHKTEITASKICRWMRILIAPKIAP